MKNVLKAISVLVIISAISTAANAATYYWTTVDKSLDKIYMNFRVVETNSATAPTMTTLGKDVQVSNGPFTSKGDARLNCQKSIKLARKNGQMVNNYCESTIKGQ